MTETGPEPSAERSQVELFAARVAHDFNNLLTGILGNLELMQNRARRSGIAEFDSYIDGARNAGGRAALFTHRLLAFSGHTAQDPAPVDINAVIRDLHEPMRAAGIAFDTELAAGALRISCDPAQAELALHELLDNAAEATRAGGRIVLRTEAAADFVVISIIDDGSGMDTQVLRRAAEPFFSTKPGGAGKGLGLAIVERFARQGGGTLELASAPGQGTTARLRLPTIAA
jgi:signal transduction histidine kinase